MMIHAKINSWYYVAKRKNKIDAFVRTAVEQ